jgi:hypothetical protein
MCDYLMLHMDYIGLFIYSISYTFKLRVRWYRYNFLIEILSKFFFVYFLDNGNEGTILT